MVIIIKDTLVSRSRVKGDSDIATTSIDNTACYDGTELAHHLLVLVRDLLLKHLPDSLHSGLLCLGHLDKDHGQGNEGSLANKVDGVRGKGLEEIQGLLVGCGSTCNTQSLCCSISVIQFINNKFYL